MSLKLQLELDIVDPETGESLDPKMVKNAWFRKQFPGGLPSLADTIGELMARTGIAVTLTDNDGNVHNVIAQTVGYATMVTVARRYEVPFGELATMSDDYSDEVIELDSESDSELPAWNGLY